MNYSYATIIGRLTRDPEIRYTSNNKAVARITVCVNRYFKDAGGQRQQAASFIPVTLWGSLAEVVEKYFRKGSVILVGGRLESQEYTDKQGNRRSLIHIVAEKIEFGERPSQNQSPQGQPTSYRQQAPAQPQPQDRVQNNNWEPLSIEEADIPF